MKLKHIAFLFSSLFLFAMLAGTLTGCKGSSVPQPTKEITTNVETKTIIRDTVFETKADSSFYRALLECQDGKVVIKKVTANKAGDHLKKPDVKVQDNVLSVGCEAEAQRLFAHWKDTFVKEYKGEITKVPYPIEKPLTGWQKFQIWCGRILLAIAAFKIGQKLLKIYKPV